MHSTSSWLRRTLVLMILGLMILVHLEILAQPKVISEALSVRPRYTIQAHGRL